MSVIHWQLIAMLFQYIHAGQQSSQLFAIMIPLVLTVPLASAFESSDSQVANISKIVHHRYCCVFELDPCLGYTHNDTYHLQY